VRYRLVSCARIEALTRTWAAYSPISGETLQLNTEAAAILELLAEGPMDEEAVCEALAIDSQTEPVRVAEALCHVWDQLIVAGLIRVDSAVVHGC
jgi:PqqD family protein of HPr-rel-A system